MQWKDWFAFLLQQERLLGAKYHDWVELTEPGDLADQFAALHHATEDLVEEAVKEFARTGQWPEPLGIWAGAMLHARLDFAVELSMQLGYLSAAIHAPPSPSPRWRRPRVIRWFLLDAWECIGFGQIHGTLERLRLKRTLDIGLATDQSGDAAGAV